jgi:hypothetical protein
MTALLLLGWVVLIFVSYKWSASLLEKAGLL